MTDAHSDGGPTRIRSMEKTNEGNDMSALWTALMEGETKESLATMVCELRGEQERDFVLEVAAQIADEFAEMFRTEPPPYGDSFWAGANIAKAIRALKDGPRKGKGCGAKSAGENRGSRSAQ